MNLCSETKRDLDFISRDLDATSLHTRHNIEIQIEIDLESRDFETDYRSITLDAWESSVPRIFPEATDGDRPNTWPLWTPGGPSVDDEDDGEDREEEAEGNEESMSP